MAIETSDDNLHAARRPYRAPEMHVILNHKDTQVTGTGPGGNPTATPRANTQTS